MVEEIKSKLILKRLLLQNFATFENQELHFSEKFNAIIGETGSGKSLILEALQYIIGFRAEKKSIRRGTKSAVIEAFFEFDKSKDHDFFESIGFPIEDNTVVIKRIISKDGNSKCFLNYQSCNLNTLQQVSNQYIDLVGQFENQKLLDEEYQLNLLDSFSKLKIELLKYRGKYTELSEQQAMLDKLNEQKLNKIQREDFIKYQIKEFKALNPTIEDEAELIKEKEEIQLKLSKSESISKSLSLLSEGESFNLLSSIKNLNSNLLIGLINNEEQEKLHEMETFISELSYNLSKASNFEEGDQRIQDIMDRLDDYQKLKRKFNCDVGGLQKIQADLESELDEFSKIDENIISVENKIKILHSDCLKLAEKLHDARTKESKKLSIKLTEGVQTLKMVGANLKYEVSKLSKLGPKGHSKVNFIAETNPGEGFHPVKSIASGGELSRILLTLRQIVSSNDSISVFLFDEIDTGVGGETALCIGKALKAVSESSQVITITHLPQIAANADALISVRKEQKPTGGEERTISVGQLIEQSKKAEFIQGMTPIH